MKLFNENNVAIATLWAEARGEPIEGMLAVGEVIRRRTALKYNSDGTIIGTCCKPWQFSCWNHDDPQRLRMLHLDNKDPVVRQCMEAWTRSQFTNHSNGAVLYMNMAAVKTMPQWFFRARQVAEIGHHTFFVEAKS